MKPQFSLDFPKMNNVNQILFIDSRDFTFENTLSYTISLTELGISQYLHVEKMTLKSLSFPKMNNSENYIILDIDAGQRRLHSSDNTGSHDKFAIMYYDNNEMNVGSVKPMKGYDFDIKEVTFNPPLSKLDKINIKFKKYGGELITIEDFRTEPTQSLIQLKDIAKHSFLLEFLIKPH